MEIEKDELVILNDDEKHVALKELKKLNDAAGQIFNWIKEDTLTQEMKDILLGLIESYTSGLSKVLKYDSEATKRIDNRFNDIRKANKQIRELKERLSSNTQIEGVTELLRSLEQALNKWWRLQGYNLVTDEEFGGYGFKGRFCLDLSHISYLATKPVTEENNRKNRLEIMVNEGYEFGKYGRKEYILLDTPKNRELITKVIKDKFKSCDISKWENWNINRTDKFQLRSFECYIRDIGEIKNLINEIKDVEEDDE